MIAFPDALVGYRTRMIAILRLVLKRAGRHTLADDVVRLRWPMRALFVSVVARAAIESIDHDRWIEALIAAAIGVSVAWLLVRALRVLHVTLLRRLRIDEPDNLRARGRVTQLELARRTVDVVIVVGTAFVLLATLTPLGRLGPSLVAYAGLIGVVLGLALRAPLENLVAGLLVAITEPIRIDDVVVVEDEWGRIEQIGLVNVAVRLWDDRRLVLPTSYFISTPFENWTRQSSHVTGSVELWVDHESDVAAVRTAYEQAVRSHPLWDGRDCALQVVQVEARGVQLRGIATAGNASDSWDLRCDVREALLPILQPPRLRYEGEPVH
ncbi:MAG TPA: mechanosensitive ion channel domain-containing protein, partial [Acidimicrobiales bacterium]|nr:mechanosensitive ion channel domain-containing protein [Acidimicrobiales bacterium]